VENFVVVKRRGTMQEQLVFLAFHVGFDRVKNRCALFVVVGLAVLDTPLQSHSRVVGQLLVGHLHQDDSHRVDMRETGEEEGRKLLGIHPAEVDLWGIHGHAERALMLHRDSAEEPLRALDTADILEDDRRNQMASLCNQQPLPLVACSCDDRQEAQVEK